MISELKLLKDRLFFMSILILILVIIVTKGYIIDKIDSLKGFFNEINNKF